MVQEDPPSIDFQTPFPALAFPVCDSPVPIYIICELLGSKVMQVTDKFSDTPTCCQEVFGSVMSLLTHKPPLTPPAKTLLFVASFGSNKIALVLPPTLFGPLSIHGLSAASPGTLGL